jgi:hypothetical protein
LARAGLERASTQNVKKAGLSFGQTLARIGAVNASRQVMPAGQ